MVKFWAIGDPKLKKCKKNILIDIVSIDSSRQDDHEKFVVVNMNILPLVYELFFKNSLK